MDRDYRLTLKFKGAARPIESSPACSALSRTSEEQLNAALAQKWLPWLPEGGRRGHTQFWKAGQTRAE